jgi:hypothetical protein
MGFGLVIRGATVVTPGHREVAHIGIADGRIAQLGGTMTGTQELAADGLLAIPGGVDAHTHLVHQGLGDRLEFPIWVDDFWSGSRAAIAGGITKIGNMTYPVPDEEGTEETPGAAITREMVGAAPEAAVDWFLHPILLHPAALSSAAANWCWLTARSRPAPVKVNGFGATERPECYPPGPGVAANLASPRPRHENDWDQPGHASYDRSHAEL